MKISLTKTSKGTNIYIIKSYRSRGKSTSQVVEKLGKLEDLNSKYGDGLAFAMKRKKELEKEELKNFSIVTFNHLLEGKDIGTIGIIGPTRMDYSKVISVMKYISKKINDDFKNGKF